MPSWVTAETGTQMTSPPHSSGTSPCSVSSCLDAVGIGVGLVDLVDGHDNGNACGLGVVDGLNRLRHDAVVGGDDQNGNVRDVGAARHAWR